MEIFEAKERQGRYLLEVFHRLVWGSNTTGAALRVGRELQRSPDWRLALLPLWRGPGDAPALPPPPSLRLGPPEAVSMSPASRSFTSGGCSRAFGDTCPVFPGPRNSLFPPGKGRLRGLRVLLVISMGVLQRLQRAQCPIRGLSFLESAMGV